MYEYAGLDTYTAKFKVPPIFKKVYIKYKESVKIFPEVKEALSEIKSRNIKIGVVTQNS